MASSSVRRRLAGDPKVADSSADQATKASTSEVQAEKSKTGGANLPGILAVCGGMLLHVVLGTLYCWGNFNSYSPENMKNINGVYDPSQSKKADTLQILPLTIVFQSLAMPVGAFLQEYIGPTAVAFVAGVLCTLGPFLASCTTSLRPFMILYAGLLGSGIGLGYTPPLVCGYKHFPNSKGVVSGLILGSFGIGGFLFNNIGSAIFNPDDLAPDKVTKLFPLSVTENFSAGLRKLSAIYLVVAFIAAPLIRLPSSASLPAGASTPQSGTTVFCAMCTAKFWFMWFAIALSAQGGLFISGMYKAIALDNPSLSDDKYLSLVGAVGSLFNGLMRPLWGMLFDRFGFKISFMGVAALQVLVLYAFPSLQSSNSLFLVGVVVSYSALAGNFTLAPAEVYKVFGNAAVYGALYTSFAFAGLIGGQIVKGIPDVVAPDATQAREIVQFQYLTLTSLVALFLCFFMPSVPAS